MSGPKLSICIPTYNRANYLKDCLNSIVEQFENKEISDQIEVVISDNASTDNTTQVVKEFQTKFKNIKYFRNDTNLGVDRNILNMVKKSTGEYCLPIGDDDGFLPGSLSYILNKIKTLDYPYYGINTWGYDGGLINPVLKHPNLNIEEDISYKSLKDYSHTIDKYIDFVGGFCGLSQIFKREKWQSFEEKEKYIGTNAIHLYILLSVFRDDPYIRLARPVIKTRSSNIRWDVFPGLDSINGRIKSTINVAKWVIKNFDLPISNMKINIYFHIREYWFTFKEIVKRILYKLGLQKIIIIYRKIR